MTFDKNVSARAMIVFVEIFVGIFSAQHYRLAVGYLMGKFFFLNFGPICACGSCLRRTPIRKFWLILPHLFSKLHNLGLEWTFWTIAHNYFLVMGYLRIFLIWALFDPVAAIQRGYPSRFATIFPLNPCNLGV